MLSRASEAAQRLAALYSRAEAAIARLIAGRLSRGIERPDWAGQRLVEAGAVRRDATRVLDSQRGVVDAEARHVIGAVYRGDPDRYARPLLERLRGAERRAAQAAADVYRSAVLAGGLQLTGSGQTDLARRRSVQRALNQAMAQGITGFSDRLGRRWSLSGYVEMAATTAAHEAALAGEVEATRAAGGNLVVVSAGPQECERCRKWMGKILTLDWSGQGGAVLVFPVDGRAVTVRVAGSLSEARSAGLFHPRCRCRIGRYRPGLTGRPVTRPDPEGQKARDRLRALERRVRELRLREAVAIDGPALAAAREARKVAVARVTEHVKATAKLGIRRDQRRERVDLGYRA